MVTPDAQLFDISDLGFSLKGQLGKSSIVIKSRHGSEVFRWNTLSVFGKNEAVSVGWVSYDDGLASSWNNHP